MTVICDDCFNNRTTKIVFTIFCTHFQLSQFMGQLTSFLF
jgi:hypothetical protein